MKNFLLIIAVMLLGATAAFSQVYQLNVSWPEEECNCLDQGHSYYAVKVVIRDVANDMVVIEGKEVDVNFGTYSVNISVPEVNDHCADPNLPNIPSFTIWVGVAVFCDSYNPPEAICNGYKETTGITCSGFSTNNPYPIVIPSLN